MCEKQLVLLVMTNDFDKMTSNLVPRVFLIGKTLVSAGHVIPLQIVVFGVVGEVRIVN